MRDLRDRLEARAEERTAELRQAQAPVEAERQRLRDALDQLPAFLVLLSPEYRVPYANRFFEERFGRSEGRRCHEYLFQRVSLGIRDVVLPGDMKELMNKVIEVQKAAEAALITRREETAAMRSQREHRAPDGAVGASAQKMHVIALLTDQVSIRRILDRLGLSPSEQTKPPPVREVLRVAGHGEGWGVPADGQ